MTTGKTIALTRPIEYSKSDGISLLWLDCSLSWLLDASGFAGFDEQAAILKRPVWQETEGNLWEVQDFVQEAVIKTIPKKKKCKRAKWLSEEALQRAERREAKSKGKKERHTHLNSEFQRIARRDKKTFLSDQCKEMEENDRMGKTRDLFKKIKRYQGNISCKDGHNKGQKWYGSNRSRRYK